MPHFKKKTRREAQRIHALRRAYERFGALPHLGELIGLIQQGKLRFVRRDSNRVTVWETEINGKLAWAVYDKERHTIVTFLYPEGNPGEFLQ